MIDALKVVGIGGGHGLAATLRAARLYASDIAAVVTVADDGGSSGRLTRELGIPPPGDIRNCLVALASNDALGELFQHRFTEGALTGHTMGNLLIAALTEMTGDFGTAVEEAGRLVGARGTVYPATTRLVKLGAHVEGGHITGQVAVARSTRPIYEAYLEPPDPPGHEGATAAIGDADQIVLGPGSLFTSLIATLLVPEIRQALVDAPGKKVFVCNNRVQKGETEGFTASAHVAALGAQVPAAQLDAIVVQSPELAVEGVVNDLDGIAGGRTKVVEADVSDETGAHDPSSLAEVLRGLR